MGAKIKRYRLSINRTFPATHPRKGEKTFFVDCILRALNCPDCTPPCNNDYCNGCRPKSKLHTICGNFDRWAKIMAEVHAGKAVIELFYWNGKPYGKGVKQIVFATLDKDSGCGVQKLIFHDYESWGIYQPIIPNKPTALYDIEIVAKNDGLSLEDFKSWFKGADLSEPMAIIHFTSFRY